MGVSVRTNGPSFRQDSSSILVAGGTRPRGHRMPDDGRLRISWDTGPPRLVLAGDIDLNSHAALIASLARAKDADGTGQVHVDMAGVTFCDVAGLRIILHGSGRGPAGGHTTLHNIPPRLRRLLDLLAGGPASDLVNDKAGASTGHRRDARSHRRCAGA